MRPIVLVILSAALLAGCAGNPTPSDAPDSPPVTGPGASDVSQALGLIGLWRVSDATGEEPDTWLRLDAVEFQLWRDCGMIMGSWSAGEEAFIASPHSASGDCVDGALPRVVWLESAASYEHAGE